VQIRAPPAKAEGELAQARTGLYRLMLLLLPRHHHTPQAESERAVSDTVIEQDAVV
jgi:hypothetical protein